jgi:hypothetical protein
LLLPWLQALELPATWAVVGGLLEHPKPHDLEHIPAVLRTTIQAALQAGQQSSFDGRDIIEAIHTSPTPHRFACHTYSHMRFTHPDVDAESVRQDLAHYHRVFPKELGSTSKFIYPCNAEAFYDEVCEGGFHTFRGATPKLFQNIRFAHLLSAAILPPPLSVATEVRPGLWRTTASLLFNTGAHRRHRLPFVYMNAIRGLRAAMRRGGTFHVWNHPCNFVASPGLLRAFIAFLRKASYYRDKGVLHVGMM